MDRSWGWLQSWAGCVDEEGNPCPFRESYCGRPGDGIVADLTED